MTSTNGEGSVGTNIFTICAPDVSGQFNWSNDHLTTSADNYILHLTHAENKGAWLITLQGHDKDDFVE